MRPPPEPDRTTVVEVNRTTLRVWEWGPLDGPPIVLTHGAFDHGRMWDGLAPDLVRRGHRVVAPDLRGHGDSGRIGSGHVWEACALDLVALIRGLSGPVGLIGHSFGAGQAMFVAAAWPELVRWVVVIDGLGPPPASFDDDLDLVATTTKSFGALERIGQGQTRVYATIDEMVERRLAANPRVPRAWLEHLVRHGARRVDGGYTWKSDPMFNVGFGSAFSPAHLEAELGAVSSPVLVLTGGVHDNWSELTDDQVAERVGWIREARHVEIADAGHYLHLEQPAATLAAIDSFLAEVDR